MPRVHTQVARTDRYRRGARIEDAKVKKGYRIDKSKPFDENDELFCKKGDTYYWWQFRNGGKNFSTTFPRQSQLTQSEFYGTVYGIMEGLQDLSASDFMDDPSSLEAHKEEIESEISQLLEELEEKQSNLEEYEGLANSPVYELITERVEGIQSWLSDFENIDCDIDYESIQEEVNDNFEDEDEETREEEYRNRLEEVINEKIEEMRDCECEV